MNKRRQEHRRFRGFADCTRGFGKCPRCRFFTGQAPGAEPNTLVGIRAPAIWFVGLVLILGLIPTFACKEHCYKMASKQKQEPLLKIVVWPETMIVTDRWDGYGRLGAMGYNPVAKPARSDSGACKAYLPMIHLVFSNLVKTPVLTQQFSFCSRNRQILDDKARLQRQTLTRSATSRSKVLTNFQNENCWS